MGGLRKTLGPVLLTFYGVGMILGAGIYSVVGEAAALAGQSLWISFALAAVAALLTGLSYAELATMFPRAGAEVVYLHETFPAAKFPKLRWAPQVFGAVFVLSKVGTAATVSLAFAGYLGSLLDMPPVLVAALFLSIATLVNVIGLRASAFANVALTVVELGGLVLVVAVAFAEREFGAEARREFGPGVLPATALVFFAFLGFEEIANLAEETHRPGRYLPTAIMAAVAITATIYVLVGFAVTSLVPPEHMHHQAAPLVHAVAAAAPDLRPAMRIAALVATANTGLIAVIATSRLLFGMARRKDLPQALTKTLPKRQTPWVAACVVLALAVALIPLGKVDVVAAATSLGALLSFCVVHLCLIVLRVRAPNRARPFRVPFAIGRVPVPPVLGGCLAIALMTQFTPLTYLVGGIALALGVALYLLWQGRRPRRRRGHP